MDAVKQKLIDLAVAEVVSFIVSQVPFFGFALINPIVTLVVRNVITIAVERTILGIAFLKIDLETAQEAADFEKAAKAHAEAIARGVKEEIEDAVQKKLAAARRLIRWG